MPRVVITDLGYSSYDVEREELAALGEVDLVLARCASEADVAEACGEADAVIVRMAPVSGKAIEAMRRCRVISRYGIGVDNVDVEAATRKGIPVCNVRDYCREEVSDHVLALLFSCARRIASRDRKVRAGAWDVGSREPVHQVSGRVLGFIGYGAIPRTLRRKVSGLGFKEILIDDPYVTDADARSEGVRRVSLDELCALADFISVHVPLNEETRHLVGAAQFALMKPTAIFINTARGPVVDTEALASTLEEGRIMAAGVDVYEPEPPRKDSRLFALDNIVLSDHMAWYSEESQIELQRLTARNAALVLAGKPPLFCVNPETLRRE
jgi:D-3-phosphoglycerate dehydrogenase